MEGLNRGSKEHGNFPVVAIMNSTITLEITGNGNGYSSMKDKDSLIEELRSVNHTKTVRTITLFFYSCSKLVNLLCVADLKDFTLILLRMMMMTGGAR